jgi:glutathione synthase/RimK-type ligase-like ATP-grasp enzyme
MFQSPVYLTFGPPSYNSVCRLSSKLFDTFRKTPGQTETLVAGGNKMKVRLEKHTLHPDQVEISPNIGRRLGLPPKLNLRIRLNTQGELELGPFFGILSRVNRKLPKRSDEYRDFVAHSKAGTEHNVVVYAFKPSDIIWSKRLIWANIYNNTSRAWFKVFLPFPHVIWNRTFNTSISRARIINTVNRLHRRGAKIFNYGVGHKWQAYKLLRSHPQIRPHLPQTGLYRSAGQVKRYLARFKGVYLKPVRGSWGKGIIRIRMIKGLYQVKRTVGRRGKNTLRMVNGPGLIVLLAQYIRAPYIVQQEIPLNRINGRIMDIRALAQRRKDGQWAVTGAVARLGRPKSVVSNLHGGGKAYLLPEALEKMFPHSQEKINEIIENIHHLTPLILTQLEDYFGPSGEVGLDFGIDKKGKVWFIEANPIPGRRSFYLLSPNEIYRKAMTHPVEYASMLAGFN